MAFDEFRKIAVAEVVFYAPVALTMVFLTLKHGFRGGWFFLLTFAISKFGDRSLKSGIVLIGF